MRVCGGGFDLDGKQRRVAELNQITAQPDFWNDADKAQAILKEQSVLKNVLDSWEKHRSDLEEARFFIDVAKDEKSEEALNEAAAKVAATGKEMAQTELAQLLGGPDDRRNAIVTLHPGAGGTEAQDWAEILLRMYLRWCDRRGYRKEILDYQPGEEAARPRPDDDRPAPRPALGRAGDEAIGHVGGRPYILVAVEPRQHPIRISELDVERVDQLDRTAPPGIVSSAMDRKTDQSLAGDTKTRTDGLRQG